MSLARIDVPPVKKKSDTTDGASTEDKIRGYRR